MPRNGSGFYTLPAGNPVVDATVIESTWANPTMSDIAVQLNGVITRDGILGPSAPIKFQDGAVGSPGITFSGATTTGFYRTASLLGFTYSGVLKLAVTSTGADITGALTTSAEATIGTDLVVVNDASVGNDLTVVNDLSVSGNAAVAGSLTADGVNTPSINGGPLAGFRNIVINGGFTINQRAYLTGGVLASGSFGHDRWKAGAGGGDYSFTQLASDTLITIAANKTLIQVIENKNVQSTDYILSWTGTAQARYAVNSNIPAGAYAASPILITGQTVGTTMSIEFGNGASAGTLGKVQLERGTLAGKATSFEQRPYQSELAMCQRYYYRLTPSNMASAYGSGFCSGTTIAQFCTSFPVEMRTEPSALEQSGTAANYGVYWSAGTSTCSAVPTHFASSKWGSTYRFETTGLTSGQGALAISGATIGYLGWSAEL